VPNMSYTTETEVNVSGSLKFNTSSLQTTASLKPQDVSATLQTVITSILRLGLNVVGVTSIIMKNIVVGEALASITFDVQVHVTTLCHFSDSCRDQASSNIGLQVRDGIENVLKASLGTVLDAEQGSILLISNSNSVVISGSTVSETFIARGYTRTTTAVSFS
jgi:hypothetical protein